ncbi:MAG: hypothetical protein M5U07_24960 [Xanthobacteraceae bacterium]|nr:hypothetical protein [Xanthobacteraceae bacterium]
MIACFPVYRTYVDGGTPTDADRRDIDWAIAQARRRDAALSERVRLPARPAHLRPGGRAQSGFSRVAVVRVAMKVRSQRP